jgi:diguanylate cyclase (GGDEF)-like protein
MFARRTVVALLPAILLGIAAPFALLAGAGQFIAGVLAAGSAGMLVGARLSEIVARVWVTELAAATRSVVEGGTAGLPAGNTFGPLAPVAGSISDIAQELMSAKEAATTDRLTQVANRPTLLAFLFAEVERVTRYGRPLSIAFVDIDHFKAVNDTYGHEAGDIVLQGVARLFKASTRQSDLVARYGGEEFVFVFPETTVDEATAVAEKVRLLVMKERFAGAAEPCVVSVSIGIAGGQGQHLRVDQLLRDADAAMYSAKALGRNQTFVFAEVDDDSARIPRAPISADGRSRAAEVGELARHAAEAALASIVDPLPHYRGKPSSLIAAIAVRMARELDQPEKEVQRVRIASLLHDIGKVAIPEQIFEKPGPLTSEEWESVVQHPRIGQVIIEEVATVRDAGAIILHHHERFSGHGYPFGLRGTEIPLGARIVAIADAYDAMVNDRPYRASIGHDGAIAELRKHAQLQFDPDLVALFCDLFGASAPLADPSLLITPPRHIIRPRGDRRQRSSA